MDGVRKVVGNGEGTRFWKDKWVGDEPLYSRFGRLFSIASDKNVTIHEKGVWVDGRWNWKWTWRRNLYSWEQLLLEDLCKIIEVFSPQTNKCDTWGWNWEDNFKFSVRSAYRILAREPNDFQDRTYKMLWDMDAPLKMKAFAWRLIQDRIPTKCNLIRRGINLNGGNTNCVFCIRGEEESDHLFCRCSFTYQVWMNILRWLGFESALNGNLQSHLLHFSGIIPKRKSKKNPDLAAIWLFTTWVIWSLRNRVVFTSGSMSVQEVVDMIKVKTWCWTKAKSKAFTYSFVEWSSSPVHCTC